MWDWTLGEAQYRWLKSTLEGSNARSKFVFAHHAIGNIRGRVEVAGLYEWGEGTGGAEAALLYEWGGRDARRQAG